MGKSKDGSIMFASESCAFSSIGGELIRDVKAGEIITVKDDGINYDSSLCNDIFNICIFEYIYFARPDSIIHNVSIYEARFKAGEFLAKECPADADIVIGVPDSGLISAKGFSFESGIPYFDGFIKNRYIGRSFIEPTQSMRENVVKIKLSPIKKNIEGKRVVMIDDSIVRGTTCKHIVSILKNDAKAKEVHVRIACPMFKHACYFGTDIDSEENLIACKMNLEEIKNYIGADSLGFLSLENLKKTIKAPDNTPEVDFCVGCFSGEYPEKPPKNASKNKFDEKIRG